MRFPKTKDQSDSTGLVWHLCAANDRTLLGRGQCAGGRAGSGVTNQAGKRTKRGG